MCENVARYLPDIFLIKLLTLFSRNDKPHAKQLLLSMRKYRSHITYFV